MTQWMPRYLTSDDLNAPELPGSVPASSSKSLAYSSGFRTSTFELNRIEERPRLSGEDSLFGTGHHRTKDPTRHDEHSNNTVGAVRFGAVDFTAYRSSQGNDAFFDQLAGVIVEEAITVAGKQII
jgi:hypothetical protein